MSRASILTDVEIRELTAGNVPLITDAPDFDEQLQPSGFDLTVRKVTKLGGSSRLGLPYQSRVATEQPVEPIGDAYVLSPGSYLVYVNEFTRFPLDVVGFAFARSTLFRCGGSLSAGVWDPGFEGRGRLGLSVSGVDALEVQLNAPIAQLVFHRTNGSGEGFKFNEYYRE